MRLTDENKKKISDGIVHGAAQLFRRDGYDAVNLDAVMGAAGLTRGAFYAHFRTKADLFAQVIRYEHPLLRMLQARDGTNLTDLHRQMDKIFADYLTPAHLQEIFRGCTLASLTGESSRADEPVRAAYEAAWSEIVTEMGRGHPAPDREAMHCALLLATSAVRTAHAMQDEQARKEVLTAAQKAVSGLLAKGLAET